MKDRFIHFILLTTYMYLLNLLFFLIGYALVDDYFNWVASRMGFENIVFIAICVFFQTIVFSLKKRFNIIIIPLLSLLCGLYICYYDMSGDGIEFWCLLIFTISKFNLFWQIFLSEFCPILTRINTSLGYAIYLFLSFYSYNFLYKKFISRIITKLFKTTFSN